ncbi:MAG: efflux RND transporter permease subunit [Myxococcales bacterium]|nr:efflux RND transporter permease subunit [Myxococcales bacterium]
MWIVRLALRRPYTFLVLALVMMLAGGQVVRKTPTDIFPAIDLPVLSVVWTYTGLPAGQMEQQITQFSEYSLAGNVGDVQRIESQTLDGVSVIRLFLQPGADVAAAMAQVTAGSQAILRRMPPGTQPPIVVRYSASSVPILQIAFTSNTLGEQEIFDHVNTRIRTLLSVVRGTRFPLPVGGRFRQISVDLDLGALQAQGLSPNDVALAVSAQNFVLPTGSAKIFDKEYRVSVNASPEAVSALNDVPIKKPDGRTIYLRDVAFVHDGFGVQTNIARLDGKRAVVLSVLKTGDASTTEVAGRIKDMLPMIRAASPPDLGVEILADQSGYVTRAIEGLLTEGLIAAALTATMILVFLGSLRSTLVVAVSIPLSVMGAALMLRVLGHNINVSTLGGLALAVGVLVDDATVEIENIHRNLAMGKPLTRAILDGAQQIAVPAFVASLSISVVFVSVVFLEGPARYLFLPMGLAVAFSVMISYLLSRTVVPTFAQYLLRNEKHGGTGPFARFHAAFERGFERFRDFYLAVLGRALRLRAVVLITFVFVAAGTAWVVPRVGRDFFPAVDAGQLRLHVTAPSGTRIEETEAWFRDVEAEIRRLVPDHDRQKILTQLGPPGGYTLAVTDSQNLATNDGEILVSLKHERTGKTPDYVRLLRRELPKKFPELGFYFQPADIVSQILNFGLPSPIDVQISGVKRDATYAVARAIEHDLRLVPGAVDVRLHQVLDAPRLHVEVDRQRAMDVGLTERDVAGNLLLLVGSSGQVSPSYWIDPITNNSYSVAVQVPELKVNSVDVLSLFQIGSPKGMQSLADLARIQHKATPIVASHVNVQPTFDVRADVQDTDLGSVAVGLEAVIDKHRKLLPPGATIEVQGQVGSMRQGFSGLALGLLVAALAVYAVMVVNFQSWLDPFIILMALPGAAIGIVVSLFATNTTFSIPSLMGAVMSIGVATANSILLVTFANEQRALGKSAMDAALAAGRVRLRPVLMTALAMLIGMLPMSLGLSEGGEQNAALGRAVIGGLAGATVATLVLVPVIYSLLRARFREQVLDPELET